MGKIFYLMGKSASGKDSIYRDIVKKMPELQQIVLYTTRPIRSNETNGVDYVFVSDERRKELEQADKIMESRSYNTVHGVWWYFTADEGQFSYEQNYIGIGTLESFLSLKAYLKEFELVPIYIEVEDGERLQRALKREKRQEEPKYAEMCRRFIADQEDFSQDKLEGAGIEKRFLNEKKKVCTKEIVDYVNEVSNL